MLYRLGGEGDQCTEVRCVRGGTHHVLSSWAFGLYNATGEASCDGKVLWDHGMMIVLSTSEGVYEIWWPVVRVEEEVKMVALLLVDWIEGC